jgi:hypothetical protein
VEAAYHAGKVAFQVTIAGATVRRILLGLLIGLLLGGLAWFVLLWVRPEDPFAGAVDTDRWQAVFLSNGQVYFGHLRVASDEFYELREAFYIRESPPTEEGQPPTREVKALSSEFHQPENRMLIRKDEVLFVENLRPDSDVAEAIERVLTAD